MITYKFNGVVHVLSDREQDSIEETGQCRLSLYIARPEDVEVEWWKLQVQGEKQLRKKKDKRRRLREFPHYHTIKRSQEHLQKAIAKQLDQSPVIEPVNYTPEERKAAAENKATIDTRSGMRKPHKSYYDSIGNRYGI